MEFLNHELSLHELIFTTFSKSLLFPPAFFLTFSSQLLFTCAILQTHSFDEIDLFVSYRSQMMNPLEISLNFKYGIVKEEKDIDNGIKKIKKEVNFSKSLHTDLNCAKGSS